MINRAIRNQLLGTVHIVPSNIPAPPAYTVAVGEYGSVSWNKSPDEILAFVQSEISRWERLIVRGDPRSKHRGLI